MITAPVETAFGPVVITPTGPWLVLEINTHSYGSEPRHKQRTLADQLEGYCAEAQSDFQILRVSRLLDPEDYIRALRSRTPARGHRELYRRLLSAHANALERLAPARPAVFLCVRLADPQLDLQARASRLLERTPAELLAAFRARLQIRAAGSLEPAALAELYERAEVAERRVLDRLDAERARTDQVQWLIYRIFCRGLGEPYIPGLDRPQAVSPAYMMEPQVLPQHGNVLRWLLEHGVERHSRYVKVTSELGDSYQAGLCLGEMSHTLPFTRGAELLFTPLEEHPFPVDASLNVRWLPNDQAVRRVNHQVARTANQLDDEEQTAHGAADEGYRRADLARELQGRLAQTGEPMLHGTLSVICAAPDLKGLETRLRTVRESFPHPLHRPLGDQLELFLQHFPGQRTLTVGYERPFTCEQIGAMVPQAAHTAGSDTDRALYIGRTLHGSQPVLMDLREASGTDRSPTIGLLGSLGGGKALADDTPIPTPDGWRVMSDLRVGDQVFDDAGQPCNVLGVYPQPSGRPCFEVRFSDGATLIADAEHRWETLDLHARQLGSKARCITRRPGRQQQSTSVYRGVKRDGQRWLAYHGNLHHTALGFFDTEAEAAKAAREHRVRQLAESSRAQPVVRTTAQIGGTLYRNGQLNHAVRLIGPLQYSEKELPLGPYTLGAWLGDGSAVHPVIWTADPQVVENIRVEGYTVRKLVSALGYRLHLSDSYKIGKPGVGSVLKQLGVLGNKHIPEQYLRASELQRRALLAGLLDTDGTVSPHGQVHYDTTSEQLRDGVLELALSLGYRATVISKRAKLYGRDCGEVYRVRFTTDDDVFRLDRKLAALRERTAGRHNPELTKYRYIADVRPVPSRPVRCIAVDSPSHLYLAGREMIPTHNTVALQLLQYQAFVQGARIVDIDPKGDHRFHLLPEVADHAQVIVLGPDPEHAGKLDPLRVAPRGERHEAAATFLIDVLPGQVDTEVQAAITGAITRVIDRDGERASCMAVIEELESDASHPQARSAGYLLRQYCQAGLVQLGFARHEDPLPAQASEQVTYLQIRALKRAHTDTVRSEMSQGQRHGRAVLQLVALYAMRILGEERDRLKVLSFDEASFLTQDALGQQLLDTLARWGRSELAVPILSTQLIDDVENQDNLIGHWFLFAMRSREHAKRGLSLLHLDGEQLLENLTERYGQGRALYRDLQGRCEEIQIDVADPRLLEQLNTRPAEEELLDDRDDDKDALAIA